MLPAESRFEILRLAYEILSDKYNSEREVVLNDWDHRVGRANELKQKLPALPVLPRFPTEEQLIETAKKLASFVSHYK